MRLRLHNVHVPYGAPMGAIIRAAAAKLSRDIDLRDVTIVRRSIDTRWKPKILWSLAVEFEGDAELVAHLPQNEASVVETAVEEPVVMGDMPLAAQPVIVGAGPAGLFAALTLAERGYRPIVVERGAPVDQRNRDVAALVGDGRFDTESNFVFGEGGAGAYSDGKLATRTGDARLRRVLEVLVDCGARGAILVDARPHIGSDVLPEVVTRLRQKIERLGGRFRFGFCVERLLLGEDDSVTGVAGADGEEIPAGAVVLAAGNWSSATLAVLAAQGVAMEAKPFQVGVRIEHPQALIDRGVYGKARGELPAAEYMMSCPASGGVRGAATFCMCPGGIIVPAISEPDHLSTNGMSRAARDGAFANSALVVTIDPDELPDAGALGGLEFQRSLERAAFAVGGDLSAPAQRSGDFLEGRISGQLPECSYPLDIVPADLGEILPRQLTDAVRRALPRFDGKIPGFVDEGLLVGIETRVSSALRIVRDRQSLESVSTPRLYPAGEGGGYAGGIMSSAVDGVRAAEAIVRRFSRPAK